MNELAFISLVLFDGGTDERIAGLVVDFTLPSLRRVTFGPSSKLKHVGADAFPETGIKYLSPPKRAAKR